MKNKNFKLEADFYRFFHNVNIENLFREVENERESIVARFYLVLIICIFIPAGILCIVLYYLKLPVTPAMYVAYIYSILMMCVAFSVFWKNLYESEYVEKVQPLIAPEFFSFFNSIYYGRENLIPETLLAQSQLFAKYDSLKVDDAVVGKHADIPFVMCKNKMILDHVETGTLERGYKVFQGICLLLQLNKKIDGMTIVQAKKRHKTVPHGSVWWWFVRWLLIGGVLIGYGSARLYAFDNILINLCGIFFGCVFIGFGLKELRKVFPWKKVRQKVRLESSDFMERWKILTDNQIEARYILSPLFMQKIKELEDIFHGYIDISFWDNNLLIAIHTQNDVFNCVSLLSDATDMKPALPAVYNMNALVSIIEILAQTKDIYTIKRQY